MRATTRLLSIRAILGLQHTDNSTDFIIAQMRNPRAVHIGALPHSTTWFHQRAHATTKSRHIARQGWNQHRQLEWRRSPPGAVPLLAEYMNNLHAAPRRARPLPAREYSGLWPRPRRLCPAAQQGRLLRSRAMWWAGALLRGRPWLVPRPGHPRAAVVVGRTSRSASGCLWSGLAQLGPATPRMRWRAGSGGPEPAVESVRRWGDGAPSRSPTGAEWARPARDRELWRGRGRRARESLKPNLNDFPNNEPAPPAPSRRPTGSGHFDG